MSLLSRSANNYPWYAEIKGDEPLQQGDFILSCQITQLGSEAYQAGQQLPAEVVEYDVVTMSQSCDLIADKIDLALVCPFRSLTELGKLRKEYDDPKMKEKLRQGHVVGFHLLNNPQLNGINDYLVVDFKSVYAISLKLLKQIASSRGNRIRLLPPYREHLSQSFARFFMRVGLPVDIPQFK